MYILSKPEIRCLLTYISYNSLLLKLTILLLKRLNSRIKGFKRLGKESAIVWEKFSKLKVSTKQFVLFPQDNIRSNINLILKKIYRFSKTLLKEQKLINSILKLITKWNIKYKKLVKLRSLNLTIYISLCYICMENLNVKRCQHLRAV